MICPGREEPTMNDPRFSGQSPSRECDHEIDPRSVGGFLDGHVVVIYFRCRHCGRAGRLSPDAGLQWANDPFAVEVA
jgi:hypothetical protein